MNRTDRKRLDIVMADDDTEDCLVVKEAFDESGLPHRIQFVHDGEELLRFLAGADLVPVPRTPYLGWSIS